MEFLTTKALADRAGVSPGTVRDYCRRGLLDPERDSSGRRLFSEDDIPLVREIHREGMSRRPEALTGRKRGDEAEGGGQ